MPFSTKDLLINTKLLYSFLYGVIFFVAWVFSCMNTSAVFLVKIRMFANNVMAYTVFLYNVTSFSPICILCNIN